MRTPHTRCSRGKRVRIVMRDGTVIIDKFLERTGNFMVLEQHGKIRPSDIRVFMIYKPRDESSTRPLTDERITPKDSA